MLRPLKISKIFLTLTGCLKEGVCAHEEKVNFLRNKKQGNEKKAHLPF